MQATRHGLVGTSEEVERALEALRKGRVVMITDPVRPEHGAVLAVAADRSNEEVVNLLATKARGITCVALPPDRAERLGLGLQGPRVDEVLRENLTVSVESRDGVTTGISASDRARTLQAVADYRTRPEDLVTPGHVFPALADVRGVLARPGWAEAAVDLARIAGLAPAVAFSQVLDESGEVATGADLARLADEEGLARVGIAAILAHRMATETFVTQLTQAVLPTRWGEFQVRVFEDQLGEKQHLALTKGEMRSKAPVLVRLHSECLTGDVLGSLRCDCGSQLGRAMQRIAGEGRGALVYLRQEGRGIGLVNKVTAYSLQDAGRDTVEANLELGFDADPRDFGVGAQMLLSMGVERVRLLTNNPRKVNDLASYGLEVVEREALEFEPCEHNVGYLKAKKERLGHLLTKV